MGNLFEDVIGYVEKEKSSYVLPKDAVNIASEKKSLFEEVFGYKDPAPVKVSFTDQWSVNATATSISNVSWDRADLVYPHTNYAPNLEFHKTPLEYKFNEDKYIAEALAHIDATYSGHYAGEIQATEVIIDAGHGTGFNIGNVVKYAKRYGKKDGYNRKDLLKMIHYLTMQLYVHDKEGLGR